MLKRQHGQGLVKYVLIIALVAVVVIGTVVLIVERIISLRYGVVPL